ncbi:MAG: hypothetical protein AABZ39_14585 [Spirochaetota bacterium]
MKTFLQYVKNILLFAMFGSLAANAQTITLAVAPTSNYTHATNIQNNYANVRMLHFAAIHSGGSEAAVVSGFAFGAAGSGDESLDISTVKIYRDNNKNGLYDGGDVQVGTSQSFSIDDGTIFLLGLNETVAIGATNHYLVLYDFAGVAGDGSSFRMSIDAVMAQGSVSGSTIAVKGLPAYGNGAVVLVDELGPSFYQNIPFASASPAYAPTNLSLYVNTDEPVFSGGLLAVTNFNAGFGTNLVIGQSVTISTCAISAGRYEDPLSSPTAENRDDDTVYNNTAAERFQNRGIVTSCFLASSGNLNNGSAKFKIASNRGGTTLVLMYETNTGNINSGGLWIHYPTPAWEVFSGNMVGYFEDDGSGGAVFMNFGAAASCDRLRLANADHAAPAVFTANTELAPCVYAVGYAVSDYFSPVLDTVTGGSNYYRILWNEILNDGAVQVSLRCDDNTNFTSPSVWTNVTNGMSLTAATPLSNRFLQYRITLYASTNGEESPEVSYLRVMYDVTNRPVVSVTQSNYADSAKTNYQFVYSNSISQKYFSYTNTLRTGYNGDLLVYATGFDADGNATVNQPIGSVIVDGLIPNVTNVTCWQNANFTGTITNGMTNFDNLVSYRFFSSNTASPQRYYYVYTNTAAGTVDATMAYTTNSYMTNFTLSPGTNYFIVRARNDAGTWGTQFVFTNLYLTPPFYVDIGANTPPDRFLANNANNAVLMQLRLQSGPVGYHVFHLKLKANGTLNDTADFSFNSLKLYLDEGNGTFDGGEILLSGDRAFNANDGYVIFDNFTNTIPANSETNFIVVGSLAGTATSNLTFYLGLEGVDALSNISVDAATTNVVSGLPVFANTNTITLVGTLFASYGPENPSQSIINSDDVNVPMLQMAIGAGPQEDVTVGSITMNALGSGDDVDGLVANGVRIVNDLNTNGVYDAGDIPITGGQTYSADNGSITFSGLNLQIDAGTTNYLLVVYDFDGSSISQDDFQMSISAVSATGVNSVMAVNSSGIPLTGAKKVVLLDLTGPAYFTGSPFVTSLFVTNTNVIIQIIPDENAYVGGTNYTDILFAQGKGWTNVTPATSDLVMTILGIFAGNTNVPNANSGNNNYTYINNVAANGFSADGVVTKYIGMSATANRTMYISVATNRTDIGANQWQGYAPRSLYATAASTATSISNLSISVKQGHGVYINVRNARARIRNTAGMGLGFRGFAGNAGTNTVNYANAYASPRFVYVGAVGYATAVFYSTNMDFTAAFSNALRMTWSNDVTGGGAITMRVRGTNNPAFINAAPWYTVSKNTVPNALTNAGIRVLQYEASLSAAPPEGGTVSPKLLSFTVDYGWKNYPIVYTVQPGGKTNYAAYQSGSGTGTYAFTNNIADTNGTVDVYATARDYFGNWASNVHVGAFIYDRSKPDITNVQCFTTPAHSFEISNDQLFYDEIVSFTVSNKVNSPSGVYYYYRLDGNPGTNSITAEIATYSTNVNIDNIGLPEGTNYFHVRAKTFYSNWGNEIVFTNIFIRPALSIDPGTANPPATNVISGASDVCMLQLRLRAGPATGIVLSNLTFTAAGGAHDINDLYSVRLFDDNGNGTLDGGDTLLASNVYNADNGLVAFTNINCNFAPNQTRYLNLIYNTKATATIGTTIAAGITNLSSVSAWPPDFSDLVSNIQYFPLWGNTNTFFRTAAITLAAGAKNPAATNVASNTTDLLVLQFTAAMNDGESVKLSNINIRPSGTLDDSFDVTAASVRLYFDNNADGLIDGGDTLLGSGSYNADNGAFSVLNINRILPANSVTNFMVVQSLSGQSTNGKWFRVSLESNVDFIAYGMTTGTAISVSGAPVRSGTINIGVDTTPPQFTPYLSFLSLTSPVPLTNNLRIYIQADEAVRSTNGPAGGVTNYPIIRVVQGSATNFAAWVSGTNRGPYTNSYNVQAIDGTASVYAEGYDYATPTTNWTNMLVGTFVVDGARPNAVITNYTTYTLSTNSNITIQGYTSESNVTISVTVSTASNGGAIFSYVSNVYLGNTTNISVANVMLSNLIGFTNWVSIYTVDAAGNTSNSFYTGIILSPSSPAIVCSKSNLIFSPLNNYATATNELIPGAIIELFLICTNTSMTLATNVVLEDFIDTNFFHFVTGSCINGDSYDYATNGVYSYTPVGIVDANVNKVKLTKLLIPAAAAAVLRYRVVVR